MLPTRTVHPPASATTLIISLGLLTTPVDAVKIVVAIALTTLVSTAMTAVGARAGVEIR